MNENAEVMHVCEKLYELRNWVQEMCSSISEGDPFIPNVSNAVLFKNGWT